MSQAVIVQTTLPDETAAELMENAVLEARLAACVHRSAVQSAYWWDGKIERAREYCLVFKTTRNRAAQLMAFINDRHPYDIPEIIFIPIDGGTPSYLRWIESQTVDQEERPT